MTAVAAINGSLVVSPRRLSELEVSKEISRITCSGHDVTSAIENSCRLALRVNGVKRLQIKYAEPIAEGGSEPIVWGASCEEAVASAVAIISAGKQIWGELRLYFDPHSSALESPLRFAKFLAQQIGLQLSRWSLNVEADELRDQIERLRKLVEKRKAIQRARAIIANTRQINDTEALLLMRKYSRESGRSLHEVSEALIFGDAQRWTGSRYAERKRPQRVFAQEVATGSSY